MAPTLSARLQRRLPSGFHLDLAFTLPLAPPPVAVVFGPSGAGKSTLLRLLAGLDRPDAGQLRLGDTPWFDAPTRLHLPPERRRVGFVFQTPALFPHLSVRENLAFSPAAPRGPALDALLDAHALGPLADRRPATLSGGQAQRVALARALAAQPHLLLLDEPLSALDAPLRRQLHAALRATLTAAAVPTLLVTHDRDEALALGDTLLLLDAGRLHHHGPLPAAFDHPPTARAARLLGWENVLPLGPGPTLHGQPLPAPLADAARRLPGPAALAVRAHALALGPAPAGALALTLRATARLREDAGHRIETDAGLTLRLPAAQPAPAPGDPFPAWAPAEALRVLPDDPA